jgi:hypothetical protein
MLSDGETSADRVRDDVRRDRQNQRAARSSPRFARFSFARSLCEFPHPQKELHKLCDYNCLACRVQSLVFPKSIPVLPSSHISHFAFRTHLRRIYAFLFTLFFALYTFIVSFRFVRYSAMESLEHTKCLYCGCNAVVFIQNISEPVMFFISRRALPRFR